MDDIVGPLILFLLVAGGGWLLGIAAFFKANRALRETAELRLQLRAAAAAPPAAAVPEPPAVERASPPEPEPEPEGPPVWDPIPVPPPRTRDWEELLTARWGVWLGAAALMLAGVFLVRYAADEGLLGPGVRCVAAMLLAATLIAAGFWLQRRPPRSGLIDHAPGALGAGGVATLFGAAFMAGPLYGLVPDLLGGGLLAAAALAGMLVSLRLGPLVAAVGILGAFVTPLLVGDGAGSMVGLFAYLLFVLAAALGTVRYAAWVWLGWATTVAAAAWVGLACLVAGPADAWAPALFVPAAALLHLVLLPGAALDGAVGRRLAWVPVAALGCAGLLLALAVPDALTRGAVLLLVPVTLGRAARDPRLGSLPWLGAVLFLALILLWGLPDWRPTAEAITVEGAVQAILPGDWAPAALLPLLWTTAGIAALFAAAGLWGERRTTQPLRWAGLAAAVPVLALAILYVRVRDFQPDPAWAAAALGLAAASTGAAAAARPASLARAGVHAAGAAAALSLGCAMLLSAQWLTLALALFVPALAAIEHATGVVALRRVAIAVAAVAAVRLLGNPEVLGYPGGALAVASAAAVAFAAAARLFRRRTDDAAVAALELCAEAFATAVLLGLVRMWVTDGQPAQPGTGFAEMALDLCALAALALASLRLHGRTGRRVLGWAWRVQGGVALLGGAALLLANPALLPQDGVGTGPVLNLLLAAYLVPALLAGAALRSAALPPRPRPVLTLYALAAVFAYLTLEIRQLFHPGALSLWDDPVEAAELWAWSGAWLCYGLALMAAGIVSGRKGLRLAALAIVGLAGAKVFLLDMAGLTGLWRVLSFLGLGLTLIGLGTAYRRFAARPA